MDVQILEGPHVRLEPLASNHLAPLRVNCADPSLWEHTFGPNPFLSQSDARFWLESATSSDNVRAFAIVEKESGDVAGSTRYLDITPEHRKLEIGWTFLARRFWRTSVNTETKLLLLNHAFEHWHALRVQFKAEAINQRSHRAILRLGATQEGTLRSFRIRPDGEARDVAFYSILAHEWPLIRARLADRNRDIREAE